MNADNPIMIQRFHELRHKGSSELNPSDSQSLAYTQKDKEEWKSIVHQLESGFKGKQASSLIGSLGQPDEILPGKSEVGTGKPVKSLGESGIGVMPGPVIMDSNPEGHKKDDETMTFVYR